MEKHANLLLTSVTCFLVCWFTFIHSLQVHECFFKFPPVETTGYYYLNPLVLAEFLKSACPQRFRSLNFPLPLRWSGYKAIKITGTVIKGAFLIKDSARNAGATGDVGLIPGSKRSPGEGNGYPLQYPCLENSMDRVVWWATVHGVTVRHAWATGTHS